MVASRREFWWGLGGLAAVMAFFFTMALLGWPGNADSCTRDVPDSCWCENFVRPGALIKQPVNTWGNLGFFVVGLLILWQVGGDRAGAAAPRNPMNSASTYAFAYGLVALFLGPGSMFFHASITDWGGWIDTYSLILFGSFGLLYALTCIFDWSGTLFVAIYVVTNAVLGVFSWLVEGTGTPIFAVLVAAWVITEFVIVAHRPGGLQRDWPWLAAALGTFAGAMVIWALSQTGRPLCNPDSLFQGHAVWHLGSAVAAGFIFLYLRTEQTTAARRLVRRPVGIAR